MKKYTITKLYEVYRNVTVEAMNEDDIHFGKYESLSEEKDVHEAEMYITEITEIE